jgi:ADP-heptose:LPS heptosyltransferase
MPTLLLNLTRFGDLLQTQPVIDGLRAQGRSVKLLCLENFAGATQFLQGTQDIVALPGSKLLADLDRGWPLALNRLHAWLGQVLAGQEHPAVINLTPVQSARLLARALGPRHIAGFGLDEQGFGQYGNAWAAFLQTSTMNRGCSPFNLVDLMLRGADLPVQGHNLNLARPNEEIQERMRGMLQQAFASACSTKDQHQCRGFVCFQMGASTARRQWPEEYFARLGNLLWEHLRICPVLLGVASERGLLDGYATRATHPYIDCIGTTSLPELAAILCQTRFLVTNDTGTMHLAAGLDRPVAAIFLATAQPWDTGPYRSGCLCLEPDLDCHPCGFGMDCPHQERCRWVIQPEHLFSLLCSHLLEDTDHSPTSDACPPRAWRSTRDAHGFMDLENVSHHEQDTRTQWIRIQRHYYRQFLDQEAVIHPPPTIFDLPAQDRRAILASLDNSAALLQILQSQAQVLASAPLDRVKQKFMAYWERLQSHWQSDPFFSVLGRLWSTQSQDQGVNLDQVQALTRRYLGLIRAWQAMFPSK